METRTLPAVIIRVGQIPEITTLEYVRYEDTGWEPKNDALHALLPEASMLELVRLAPGYDLWCDEEGRLRDGAKASCLVNAPGYAGDIAGDCVLALDMTRRPYSVLADMATSRGIEVLTKQLLFGFGVTHIGPVREGHTLAEATITVTGLDEDEPMRCMTCGDDIAAVDGFCKCDVEADKAFKKEVN